MAAHGLNQKSAPAIYQCQFAMLCNEGFSFDLGERGSFQNKSLYALKTNERKHILEIGQLKVIIDSLRK